MSDETGQARLPDPPRLRWAALAILLAMVAVEVFGFLRGGLFGQQIWDARGQARLIQFAGLYWSGALPVLLIVPWLFVWIATGALALITLVLLPKALIAVGFFLFSAWSLGSLVRKAGVAESTLLGIALYLIPMPLLARLPVHYPIVWAVLLAIPILVRRPRLRVPSFTPPPAWSFALLAFIFTIHWFAMLKPEAGADGLAMHLAVPADIARHHVLTFEPTRYLWAVMPMGGDLLYSIVYQFGGEHGARLLNLAMLGLLLALLHTAVRNWLLLALFAATPLAFLVTGELFIENILASLLLGAFLAVGSGAFLPAALLCGAALATKIGALPFVILLVVYARRGAPAMLAVLILAAAPTYAVAWAKTGSPLFPFLQDAFHSPLIPPDAQIRDNRFRQPLTWRTPYDLTFRSNLYFEGQDGSFGFQHIVFAALALIAALLVRQRAVTAAALIGLAASLAILRSDPNARYLYPELPLLAIPFAALLAWSAMHFRVLWRGLLAFAISATLLNIWFMGASSYWHKDLYGPFTDAQRREYLGTTAPIRAVAAWFERVHPGAPVLLTHDTAIADFSGPVYENQWHQYNTLDRIRRAPDAVAVKQLLAEWGVRYVIARTRELSREIKPQTLRDLIDQCSAPEFTFADFRVLRLNPGCVPTAQPDTDPQTAAPAGLYDDFDPALQFRGEWERARDFAEPLNHTISYSDGAGAEMRFAFTGTRVDWIGARAPNRGIAEVVIDGVPQGAFDLYAPAARWRQRLTFGGLAAGRHLLIIRATGRRRPEASGTFLDVDALEVK